MYKHYDVICEDCGSERRIKITVTPVGDQIDWLEDKVGSDVQIISGRKRLDNYWGWQCLCGNNSLMTNQEKDNIENYAAPKPKELSDIIANLQQPSAVHGDRTVLVDQFTLKEA